MSGRSNDLIQGTLDMLILKVLTSGSMHGYAIVKRIHQVTDDALQVEEGSLYPALHRMEAKGWIEASWGLSDNNRRAKYYRLTEAGHRQLETEISIWTRLSKATAKVLGASPEGA